MATITKGAALEIMTFKEASKKLENQLCCFTLKKLHCHLALSPKHIGGFLKGIQKRLNDKLLLYSKEYGGVPIVFKGAKVDQRTGWLMDDRPEIHIDVITQCIVFSPAAGSRLIGVVNKIGPSFIGCLVHGAFNATLRTGKHQDSGADVGSEIEFEVTELHVSRRILSMSGRLIKVTRQSLLDSIDSSLPMVTSSSSGHSAITASASMSGESVDQLQDLETGDFSAEDSTTSKKKKKKRKLSECAETNLDINGDIVPENVLDNFSISEVKKRKKRKLSESAETNLDSSLVSNIVVGDVSNIFDDSDLSDVKKKKKKKHKHREENN